MERDIFSYVDKIGSVKGDPGDVIGFCTCAICDLKDEYGEEFVNPIIDTHIKMIQAKKEKRLQTALNALQGFINELTEKE